MSNNLTGKLAAKQYYIHKSFVNVYYYVYKFLEKWIADNIFRGDTSRVFMASDGYAFRRRFELTDMSKNYDDLEFSSLNLPFANYFAQNNGWTTDDRIAAKNAALTYLGIYEGNTKIKASASVITVPVTFWFNREDDARLAYEILYFKSYNEQYNHTKVPYGRNTTLGDFNISQSSSLLDLPINFMIKSLVFNPQFTETDWLKRQRVFTIKVSFDVRTYTIYPPNQPNYTIDINDDGTLEDGSTYEDGYNYYYLVDRVILNTSSEKNSMLTYDAGYNPEDNTYSGSVPFPTIGVEKTFYVDSYKKDIFQMEGELNSDFEKRYKEWCAVPSKVYIWDSLNNRYIEPDKELDYASITVYGTYEEDTLNIKRFDFISNIGENSNIIMWELGDNEYEFDEDGNKVGLKNIESLEINLVNTCETYVVKDILLGTYTIDGLSSGTQYMGYAIFKAKNDSYKKYPINFRTNGEITVQTKSKPNSLVGLSW